MATHTMTSNAKDSMKSTWRTADRKEWTAWHWVIEGQNMHYRDLNKKVPVHSKADMIQPVPEWQLHRWILSHAAVPLVLHQAYVSYFDSSLHPVAAMIFYAISFFAIGIHQVHIVRRMGHRYGFLDGDKARNDVPDNSVAATVGSLLLTVGVRTAMMLALAYERNKAPRQLNWRCLVLEIGIYGIVIDFWFYWYHR